MLNRLGRFVFRRRRAVLTGAVLFVVASFAVAGGVADRLTTGGFADPNSESERAATILEHQFHAKDPNIVLLVTAKNGAKVERPGGGRRRQPDHLRAGGHARPRAGRVVLEPRQRAAAVEQGRPPGARPRRDQGQRQARRRRHRRHLEAVHARRRDGPCRGRRPRRGQPSGQRPDPVRPRPGRGHRVPDHARSCSSSCSAASSPPGLPLLVGVVAIARHVPRAVRDLVGHRGLGLLAEPHDRDGSRPRDRLQPVHRLALPRGAARWARASRTPWSARSRRPGARCSGARSTVAVALGALLLFPLSFLRSFAYAGIAVSRPRRGRRRRSRCPALLGVLGHRVDSLRLFRHREPKPVGEGVWHRIATTVMRRPIPIATAVIVLLVLLGLPFLRIEFGLPDDRVLPGQAVEPPGAGRHPGQLHLERGRRAPDRGARPRRSPGRARDGRDRGVRDRALEARTASPGSTPSPAATSTGRRVPVGPAVTQRFESDHGTWLSVVPSVEPLSPAGEQLAKAVRAICPRPSVTGS